MAQSKFIVDEVKGREEETTLCWIILNFKELLETAKSTDENLIFRDNCAIGGTSLCTPTNWRFSLKRQHNYVGMDLEFLGPGSASAKWTASVRNQKGEFPNFNSNLGPLHKYEPGEPCEYANLIYEQNLQQFLPNGVLQLKIKVTMYVSPTETKKMLGNLSQDFKKGLDSCAGADMTFIFVEEEGSRNVIDKIKAHRTILSLRSPVFATMFGSGMTEATNGEVRISDMTPKAMKMLLKYMYSGEMDSEWGSVAEELLYGADKYELTELQKYLDENVASVLTPENVIKIRNLASLYNLQEAMDSTVKFIQTNTEALLRVQDVIFKNSLK